MKFINSNFAKKLIILLVAIIAFNAILPNQVMAADWDIGGILLKPLVSLTNSLIGTLDATFGWIMINEAKDEDVLGAALDDIWNGGGLTWENSEGWSTKKLLIGADSIISGDVGIFNANIFKTVGTSELREDIRTSVAKIYVTLRNISAIIMLIGLVYTGIQILLSSNIPTKKTQYLILLQDWVIGMCLLIFSHIIMLIIFNISDLFVEAFQNALTGSGSSSAASSMNGFLIEKIADLGYTIEDMLKGSIYIILVLLFIYETALFMFTYFKRLLYINVLVMFAPIFSIMYAFGQQTKQIYSKWLKEFIMGVFIQPFHIIVYYVLIMVPIGLIEEAEKFNLFTILYAGICILFIRPAEEYLRGLVGMNQSTVAQVASDTKDNRKAFDDLKARTIDGSRKVWGDAGSFIMSHMTARAAFKVLKEKPEDTITEATNPEDTLPGDGSNEGTLRSTEDDTGDKFLGTEERYIEF